MYVYMCVCICMHIYIYTDCASSGVTGLLLENFTVLIVLREAICVAAQHIVWVSRHRDLSQEQQQQAQKKAPFPIETLNFFYFYREAIDIILTGNISTGIVCTQPRTERLDSG